MWRYAVTNVLIGSAALVGGVYLYSVYGPKRHRLPLGLSAGLLLGQQYGAMTGLAVAGPGGAMVGAVAGGIAGAVVGHEAMNGATA